MGISNTTESFVVLGSNGGCIDFLIVDKALLQEKEIAAVLKEIYGNTDGMQFTPIEDVDVRQRIFQLHKGDKLESTIYNYYLNRAKKNICKQ